MSKDEQELSPDAQRSAIAAWSEREGVRIASWHFERGVRGKTPVDRREALQEALVSLDEHSAGLLVVLRRDRLARDVVVAAMIERLVERQGARIVSTDGAGNAEGPEGLLVRGIMDLFAQYESLLIGMRTRAALQVKRDRGEKLGVAPLGFRNEGGKLVPDEGEARAIEAVLAKRQTGASLRRIVRELNEEGTPCRGKRWHLTTIASIVTGSEQPVETSA